MGASKDFIFYVSTKGKEYPSLKIIKNSIGLNQSYINKYTKELVEEGNVDSLESLFSMIAYSGDLDSYGRLSRFVSNANNDYSILFIEFKGLNG